MKHVFKKNDLVSWKSGKKTYYGRFEKREGKNGIVTLCYNYKWGEERVVPLEKLVYEPPVVLSVEALKKYCRFEIRFVELMQGRLKADREIPEKYQIVLDDLKTALQNYRRSGLEESEFGSEYYWPVEEYLYFDIGMENADNEPSETEWDGLPNSSVVFGNVWEIIQKRFDYGDEDLTLDDAIAEIQTWEENKDKPLLERQFSDKQKHQFIGFWTKKRLARASEEIKEVYRKILDELCDQDDVGALKTKAYACYGNGNAAYGQNWEETQKCLLRLMELDPDPQTANTLGYMYYYGRCTDGVPEYDKAFYYFSIGAAGWYYESRYKLADMFWHGYGVAKNPKASATLIWELYGEQLKLIRAGKFGCNFADVALRAGNIWRYGIDCSSNMDSAFFYYLQAQYAIRMRMLEENNFGDTSVAAGIDQAIREILSETSYEKPIFTKHYYTMYFLLQCGLNRKHQMEMKIKKLSDSEAKLTFRIVPYENEKYGPKLFVTVPDSHFCGLMEKVTVRAKKIETFRLFEDTDTIRFDSITGDHYYLYGKEVAEIEADFVFNAPKPKGKKYSFVSVIFNSNGKQYDYLSDIPLEPGDKAVVNGMKGEAVVEVVAAFEKSETELALPLKKYKKILRKVEP